MLQIKNDPISIEDNIPYQDIQLNPHIIMAVVPFGGHLGYFVGNSRKRWNLKVTSDFMNALEDNSRHNYFN